MALIAPGAIRTEMFRDGKPEEIAALAPHICESDYLNGVCIRLDAGRRVMMGSG